MSAARLSKLAELRAKTDQDLVRIISSELESGLQSVAAETSVDSSGARSIYANALRLLPKVENLNERRKLEANLEVLRERLKRRRAVAVGCI